MVILLLIYMSHSADMNVLEKYHDRKDFSICQLRI